MNKTLVTLACFFIPLSACGCEDGFLALKWNITKEKPDVEEGFIEARVAGLSDSLAYRNTVAEQGWIEGLRRMRVRGYGVVVGLGTRGSRECPQQIRERLIQEMHKRGDFSGIGMKPSRISPEQFLDDLDTAVVVVEGEIPAAVVKGATFDVTVRALPGTQTTSLEGGRLYTVELHLYRNVSAGGAIEGKTLATASGAIFVNPFGTGQDAATKWNKREGYVLGGGVARENRRIRFVLSRPSYQKARNVARVINARFPNSRKTAEAMSPSYVNLRVPRLFARDPFRFIAILRHLYLPSQQGFSDKRANELAEEIVQETASHPDIALAWEGIGRTVLPVVQKLYTDHRPHARFYAAITGLRLKDNVAVEVIEQFAADAASPYRLTAIGELGRASNSVRAAIALRQLLDDPDPRIRVEVYEAMLVRNDRIIETRPVGRSNFALDLVPSSAGNLIYVRRTGAPRIALLGSAIQCLPPVFYADANGMITISAMDDDKSLTLIRRTPFGNRTSPPLTASLDVSELIDMLGDDPQVRGPNEVHGLAIDYSTITHVLYELCRMNSLNAKFMLQNLSVTEMFGPTPSTGRAESDL